IALVDQIDRRHAPSLPSTNRWPRAATFADVRELAIPALVSVHPADTLTDSVFAHAQQAPGKVLFGVRRGLVWEDVTAAQFARDVEAVAKGLLASGLNHGDRVALMSKTRYEWTLVDYAIWAAGAVTVPVYETSSAEQVQWILADSGASLIVVESERHEELVQSVREDLDGLMHVWQIDNGAIESLSAAGSDVGDEQLAARRRGVSAESLATIVYTSGTTGRPKGCRLTHRNLLFEVRNALPGLAGLFNAESSTLLFLPLAHIFARIIQIGSLETQAKLGHTADVKSLLSDFAEFGPTFVLSVPRVFEKIYNAAKQGAHADGRGKIFDLAEDTAISYSRALDRGRVGLLLRLRHEAFDRLVYAKLRDALGGGCRATISGGAPLGARLGHFFRGIGLTVYEGYGLTETSATSTVNLEQAVKIGSVGRPFPGVSIRISAGGEVLVKGQHVFEGYWNNAAATRDVLTDDGWFHTGDIGAMDDQGFLTISGRRKELLVTAGGKNVAPIVLEDRLRAHPLISQCIVVGDQRPFIGALITLDADALPEWIHRNSRPADATAESVKDDKDLRAEIQTAVDEANLAVSEAEAIRVFRILGGDFTEDSGELTPKNSLKRNIILKNHAAEVDAIYAR
ncbi:MAG: AMP-dependent synthetase/ligase, partial [Geodermatophilaceae bacterium]